MENILRRRWARLSGGKQLAIVAALAIYFLFGLAYFGDQIWRDGYPTFSHLSPVEWVGILLWFLESLGVLAFALNPKTP